MQREKNFWTALVKHNELSLPQNLGAIDGDDLTSRPQTWNYL